MAFGDQFKQHDAVQWGLTPADRPLPPKDPWLVVIMSDDHMEPVAGFQTGPEAKAYAKSLGLDSHSWAIPREDWEGYMRVRNT